MCTLTSFSCTAHTTKQLLAILRQGVYSHIRADNRLIEVCRASRESCNGGHLHFVFFKKVGFENRSGASTQSCISIQNYYGYGKEGPFIHLIQKINGYKVPCSFSVLLNLSKMADFRFF